MFRELPLFFRRLDRPQDYPLHIPSSFAGSQTHLQRDGEGSGLFMGKGKPSLTTLQSHREGEKETRRIRRRRNHHFQKGPCLCVCFSARAISDMSFVICIRVLFDIFDTV